MSEFQDFFIDEFENVETVEKTLKIGGKERKVVFKPITAAKGDELRKECRKVTIYEGQKIIEIDQDKFTAKLIIETTVHPNFRDKQLQENWGVLGAENLLEAMKSKMLDGEYGELAAVVSNINGYKNAIEKLVEEVKN